MTPDFKYFRIICLLFLNCLAGRTMAQQNDFTVSLNGQSVVLSRDISNWIRDFRPDQQRMQSVLARPLQLPLSPDNAGSIRMAAYLGQGIYLLHFHDIRELENFSRSTPLTGIGKVSPDIKIQAYLADKIKTGAYISVLLRMDEACGKAETEAAVQTSGGKILPGNLQSYGIYTVSLPAGNLSRLASHYGVQYISRVPELSALDQDSKGGEAAVQLNMPVALGGAGLSGKGIVIGHGDESSGIYHVDMEDRIINYNPNGIKDHGVLTNGVLGGDGIMDPAGQGIATDAVFLSHYFSNIVDLQEAMFKGHGMIITNNSYASIVGSASNAGVYDILSQYLDRLAFKTPEVLDIFAAGNDGRNAWNGYPAGYANVCGGYQPSKNTLVVGALYRNLAVGEGSSRGPVRDGRLKPEMTAMGMDIMCPVPDNTYTITRGTSLACPQVAGGAALIAERYKALNAGANPRSDLLKTLMMNGCTELGNPGPDFLYGFGLMNLRRSLEMLEQRRYERSSMSAGGAPYRFTLTVPAGTAQLKVMLYYHDPAASPSATTQLVNDLDLTVAEPGGTIHRPLILDPSVTGVSLTAAEGTDRLNNVEQVTINTPVAGSYTITVSGFRIPEGPQDFVVAYDFVPDRIQLLYPTANAASPSDTAMYIYWDAPYDPVQTFNLDYSPDNGSSWLPLTSGIPANTRCYKWSVPLINSPQCRIRLTRGSAADTSGPFTLNIPPLLSLDTNQCPGSIAISWTEVAGADKYYLLLKDGPHFRKVDSVGGSRLAYTFRGLRPDTRNFVAVQPALGGRDGYRSNALIRKPADGDCNSIAHGDISLEAITAPLDGRRFTRSAMELHTPVRIRIRNQDNLPVNNYSVSYQVNGGAWTNYPGLKLAAGAADTPIIEYYNFLTPGDYTLTVAIHNNDRPDPVPANDTITRVIRHLPNNPISLLSPLVSDFESLPDITISGDTVGLTADGFWDYSTSTDTGRLRSRVPGSPNLNTAGSISMDVSKNSKNTLNYFTGTFNLAAYDTSSDEIRLDFDYEMRGMPVLKDSNKVWVRGRDTLSWIPLFTYSNDIDTGALHHSGSLSLRDALIASGQNFSSSTQVRFGQFDSSLIVDDHYGGGLSLDNIRLYKVQKDLDLAEVISPRAGNCDYSGGPVTIKIKNGTTEPAAGITAGYSLDGGSFFTEAIPDLIEGKDSLLFTFSKPISGLPYGVHELTLWIHIPGDDYPKNDSFVRYRFISSPLVDQFPYLQDFEAGSGNWYAEGFNSSWAYGTPASPKVSYAASGIKAWKTNLSGPYNSKEKSYLYSPCFNTSGLESPMLSFSTFIETEYCSGTVCDEAHMEYSTDDGYTWAKLDSSGTTNWYNDDRRIWSIDYNLRWRVASVPLPKATRLKLRFVLQSDPGANLEGIAVDDIHIFDKKATISFAATEPWATAVVQGRSPIDFIHSSGIVATILPQGQDAGNTLIKAYPQSVLTDNRGQYLLPRSLVLSAGSIPAGGLLTRLFVTDYELLAVLNDTSCNTCSKAPDIYRTGVSSYLPATHERADSTLDNNTAGNYSYLRWDQLRWVPYDQGYYAEFTATRQGEYWFNDGGITGNLPVRTQLLQFEAARLNESEALLSWHSDIDTLMQDYTLERSADHIRFDSVARITALKTVTNNYTYTDLPQAQEGDTLYYRLYCNLVNGKQFYSDVKTLYWIKSDQLLNVYPVPSNDGNLHIQWTATPGSEARLQISSVTGQSVFNGTLTASGWKNDHQIRLGSLSKGVFFLKMTIGNNTFTRKLLFY